MKKIYLLSLLSLLVFASCSKNEGSVNETPTSPRNMLVFDNVDEFLDASTKVSNMSNTELEAYEELNGYKSLGRMAEEVFYSVDPDDFTSEKEMQDFLDANKEYVNLVADENGELTAEPAFNQNEYKYLMNEDQMFEINGTAYKVFEEGMVSAPKDQVNKLMSLDSRNLQSIQSNNEFMYTPFEIEEALTKVTDNHKGWAGTKRDRMHVLVAAMKSQPVQGIILRTIKVKFENHRKRLGIWWTVKRNTTYNFLVKFTVDDIPGVITTDGNKSEFRHEKIYTDNAKGAPKFTQISVWAESDQTGRASIYK